MLIQGCLDMMFDKLVLSKVLEILCYNNSVEYIHISVSLEQVNLRLDIFTYFLQFSKALPL